MAETELKEFTLEEVAQHNTEKDCYLLLDNGDGIRRVLDVTAFLDDHPGGPEIMTDFAGQDCTEDFEDIGHSNDARAQAEEFVIGKIKGDVKKEKKSAASTVGDGRKDISGNNTPVYAVVALAAVALAYFFKGH